MYLTFWCVQTGCDLPLLLSQHRTVTFDPAHSAKCNCSMLWMVTSSMLRVTDSWGGYLVYADLLQGQLAHICMSPKGVKKGLSRHALRQRSRCSICSYLNINIPGSKHWQPYNSPLATYTEILIDKIPDSQRHSQSLWP